ncbi:Protein ea59 [Candidatus Electrothrix laxa]
MQFRIVPRDIPVPPSGKDTVYLKVDRWNDYAFVTMFYMSLHDESGQFHEIGSIKIGFKGQKIEINTYTILPNHFDSLGEDFFSLGESVDFYCNMALLPTDLRNSILSALRDIVLQPDIIEGIKNEEVFSTSLLRYTSLSRVKGQYARVLVGKAELTNFNFKFIRPEVGNIGGIDLSFDVKVGSTPSTNIHAVIGRNGVGKTTLLNGMIEAITYRQGTKAKFINTKGQLRENKISDDYFSSLVSISFSAFDSFSPPQEQPDPAKGTCYFYIGLKDPQNGKLHRTIRDLQADCAISLINCLSVPEKTERWLNAIEKLGSDEIFASMNLEQLETIYRDLRTSTNDEEQFDSSSFQEKYQEAVSPFLSRMSSGHAIILLTITRLVATVEEKTLVLFDEPESHLHPPLLSAFVRALADLLHDRNGVAIIATHSPVVLQEIPKSCVWKIFRRGANVTTSRPNIETFAENVGVLTSEVFSLEVERSGFHDLLANSVSKGKTYEEIMADYDEQLGFEGRAILAALIAHRDRKNQL